MAANGDTRERRFRPVYWILHAFLFVVSAAGTMFVFGVVYLFSSFFLWVIGHFGQDLLQFGEYSKSVLVDWICTGIYYVIPNLSIFKIMGSRHIIQSLSFYQPIDPSIVAAAFFYCILYCAVILLIAIAIFLRRDFK